MEEALDDAKEEEEAEEIMETESHEQETTPPAKAHTTRKRKGEDELGPSPRNTRSRKK